MSFFLKANKTTRKKKGTKKDGSSLKRKAKDEEFESGSENLSGDEKGSIASDEEIEETPQEKRLRLAKEYLAQLEAKEGSEELQREVDRDAIVHRLQEDALEHAGRLQRFVADKYSAPPDKSIRYLKGHKLSVTSVTISDDERFIFSASKDGSIIKWDTRTGGKLGRASHISVGSSTGTKKVKGQILAIAITSDGKYLASGGDSTQIHIWNPDTLSCIHTFKGHKKSILGLSFRRGTHQLFSASADRSVKVWSLDEMAYVETLFGHEDSVLAIDSLIKDRALTCGARDRSVRLWKIPEESQLLFRDDRTSSIDCVAMINEETFVSADDNGGLALWNIRKKRPTARVEHAHGAPTMDGKDREECWVSSLAAVRNGDLLASAGSCDSSVRLWKCESGGKRLTSLFNIHMDGFVNCLRFSDSGAYLVAAVGQEHRLGRWWKHKGAKNVVCVVHFDGIKPNGVL